MSYNPTHHFASPCSELKKYLKRSINPGILVNFVATKVIARLRIGA